jgi:hypothetical protein
MFLAFFIDQAQQLTCPLFQHARKASFTKKKLWDGLIPVFRLIQNIPNWDSLLSVLARSTPLSIQFYMNIKILRRTTKP